MHALKAQKATARELVKRFFQQRTGNLLVPPDRALEMQTNAVDVPES